MALFGLGSSLMKGSSTSTPTFDDAYIATGPDGEPYVKDPAKLWKEVMELRDDALSARKAHERVWALCWMFYRGDQWRKPAPAPDWNIVRINVGKKPKITLNKILPMVQTRRAHVLKNRPTGVVMPKTISEEDRNAARTAQDVLNYDQEHLKNWELLDGKLSLCMFVTGNAFKKVYFDPSKTDKKEVNKYRNDPNTGAPVETGMQGQDTGPSLVPNAGAEDAPTANSDRPGPPPLDEEDTPQVKETPEGDVVIEFVPPEEILPEPASTTLEDCQRLLHRTLKPLKWVKDVYGEAAKNVDAVNLKTERGKSIIQGAKLFGLTEREVANRVEVLEAWFRPTEDFPEGLHAVWADDKLMAAGPTPDAHEAIPFVHYAEIETDEFWGISSVSQVIDPQKALNLAVSRDEFMRQRLRPKLICPTDAGLDEAAYSNDDSEIVFYHHPFKPSFTEPPAFQRDEKAVEFFKAAVDDIGGSADVMRGQISGGGDIRSGRMVNYLQEYAGTVLAGPARAIERGEERTGNMILRLRKHYTTEKKLYYIVGRDRNVEVKQFIGSDIQGAADYIVQAGSALPMSMAEKRDTVLSLVEKGVLPPGDPRIIKMMGMPSDVDELFNEDQLDRDNATEEDHRFLKLAEEDVVQTYDIIQKSKLQQAQLAMSNGASMGSGSPMPGEDTQPAPAAPAQGGPSGESAPENSAGPISSGGPGAGSTPQTNAPGLTPEMLKPTPGDVMTGLGMEPRDFENHVVHLEVHNRSRKSQAYRALPKAVQAIYDEHCDMHAYYLLPPPMAPAESSPGGKKPAEQGGQEGSGSPSALQGKQPPGKGGAGNINAEGNQERNAGMPPSRSAPNANAHHLI